ncbi:hypothetical protein D3C87_1364880 [compost metagenome]
MLLSSKKALLMPYPLSWLLDQCKMFSSRSVVYKISRLSFGERVLNSSKVIISVLIILSTSDRFTNGPRKSWAIIEKILSLSWLSFLSSSACSLDLNASALTAVRSCSLITVASLFSWFSFRYITSASRLKVPSGAGTLSSIFPEVCVFKK